MTRMFQSYYVIKEQSFITDSKLLTFLRSCNLTATIVKGQVDDGFASFIQRKSGKNSHIDINVIQKLLNPSIYINIPLLKKTIRLNWALTDIELNALRDFKFDDCRCDDNSEVIHTAKDCNVRNFTDSEFPPFNGPLEWTLGEYNAITILTRQEMLIKRAIEKLAHYEFVNTPQYQVNDGTYEQQIITILQSSKRYTTFNTSI